VHSSAQHRHRICIGREFHNTSVTQFPGQV
jgi:hypothetical protein